MKFKTRLFVTVIILLLATIGFREWQNQQSLHKLRDEIAQLKAENNNQTSSAVKAAYPPSGNTITTNWLTIKSQSNSFSLQYPSSWAKNDEGNVPVIPKRLVGHSQDSLPLSLTTSSNLTISSTWRQITLASGEKAYYNFEEGIDFYYIVNGTDMLIWSIPVRSHDSLLTNQELIEATQIINTYHKLSVAS